MVYLIGQLWLYLLCALALGAVFGWMTCRDGACCDADRKCSPVTWMLVLAGLVALFAAILHWLRNDSGLWLDTALLLLGAYLIGCLIACIWCCWCARCRAMKAGVPAAAAATAAAALAAKPATPAPVKPAAPAPAPVKPAAPPAPPVQKPFALSGAYDGKGLTLSGHVGSEADRAAIVSAARAALPGASLTDRLALASGSPDGYAALASYGLGQLGRFARGTIGLVDKTLSVDGEVGDQPAHDAVMAALKHLPAGGSLGKVMINVPAVPHPLPQAPSSSAPVTPVYEMAKVENEDNIPGQRPASLRAARGGKADDLKLIRGIGKQNEGRLHGLGIWHFDQIAAWTEANALWVGSFLAFPGRIEREEWIKQAKVLASGAMTEFAKRVEAGEVATSKDDGSHGQGNVEKLDPTKGGHPGTPPKK